MNSKKIRFYLFAFAVGIVVCVIGYRTVFIAYEAHAKLTDCLEGKSMNMVTIEDLQSCIATKDSTMIHKAFEIADYKDIPHDSILVPWKELLQSSAHDLSEASILHLFRDSTLYLHPASLGNIPAAITSLKQIRKLYIYCRSPHLNPQSIGNHIFELKQLRVLSIQNSEIDSLPAAISQLKDLKQLYLSNNKLSHLPNEIGQLQQLEVLELENNQLTSLPDSLGKAEKLQIVKANNNKLNTLPASISQLKKLHTVELNSNFFNDFMQGLQYLTQVKNLDLTQNQLTSIPSGIEDFQNLEELKLSFNPELRRLAPQLASLPKLEQLHLQATNLPIQPNSFKGFKSLKSVSLSNDAVNQRAKDLLIRNFPDVKFVFK